MLTFEDVEVEISRLIREAEKRARAKIAAQQLGELFADLKVTDRESNNG